MVYDSRLSRSRERKSKQTLFLTLFGIIVFLVLLFKFGIPFLVNLSLFFSGAKQTATSHKNSLTFVAPPILNPTFTATNTAQISVSGTVSNGKEDVELFINGNKKDTVTAKDDGTFKFDNVSLQDGSNDIKAKAKTTDNKESDFSDSLTIALVKKAPTLSVDAPSDGQTFSKDNNNIQVNGKTDPDMKVTVNGFWAIVDSSGNYKYMLTLQKGDNQIKVVATDQAGNTAEKSIKVIYNP
ncbi:MAG TPA: hypothetical protein VLF68_01825 [Candidatus Saccharimonadales bacterium]|nr:hypothetical protein [Candidatus Saccharimonadales bacterium]